MRIGNAHWFVALAIAGAFLATAGCKEFPQHADADTGHAVETTNHEPHEEHDADCDHEKTEASVLTPDEILAAQCEHDIPTYQCATCRYEVGVVKVDPSLLKDRSPDGVMRLTQAGLRKLEPTVHVTGEVRLNENRTVRVTSRIPGIVRSVGADIGSAVTAGDILLEVDSGELGEVVAAFEKNRALLVPAEENYRREKSLWEQQIAAEKDLLDARGRLEEVRVALREAEQKLRVLGLTTKDVADIKSGSHDRLRGTLRIRAAQDGTVLTRRVSVGEAVKVDDELMTISDLSTVWAWFDVFDRDLDQVLVARRNGDVPVELRVRAFPDKVFTGRLDQVGPLMEEETRTVKARAIIENPDGLLRPGMFCEGLLALPGGEETLAVPVSAVMSDEGMDFVFKPLKDDYFYRQNIRKGREFSEFVEVLEGVAPGETLVVEGAFLLKSDILRSKMGAGCAD